jgi:hypothetical protein
MSRVVRRGAAPGLLMISGRRLGGEVGALLGGDCEVPGEREGVARCEESDICAREGKLSPAARVTVRSMARVSARVASTAAVDSSKDSVKWSGWMAGYVGGPVSPLMARRVQFWCPSGWRLPGR